MVTLAGSKGATAKDRLRSFTGFIPATHYLSTRIFTGDLLEQVRRWFRLVASCDERRDLYRCGRWQGSGDQAGNATTGRSVYQYAAR